MPYFFADNSFFTININSKVIGNWKELSGFNDPKAWFPPGVQWVNTAPFAFSLINLIIYGLGIPLSLILLFGIFVSVKSIKNNTSIIIPLSFLLTYYIYQSVQYAKPMRYLLPIYPMVAIFTGIGANYIYSLTVKNKKPKAQRKIILGKITLFILTLFSLLWSIAFISIYTRIHPRVMASKYIYNVIPPKTILTSEHWDDPLPLNIDGKANSEYEALSLELYSPESKEKWQKIKEQLIKAEYIIISSNRVYGSVGQYNKRYNTTNYYYQQLFNGNLGFTLVSEFSNRPSIPFPVSFCITPPLSDYGKSAKKLSKCNHNFGITIIDDYAEESFTVYDHPKVFIFKKTNPSSLTLGMDQIIALEKN